MSDIVERLRKRMVRRELGDDPLVKVFGDAADEIERLEGVVGNMMIDAHVAADEIERLRAALRNITDHFADVMGGPLIEGQGVKFANGVEGIPTIAAARAALGEAKDE